MFLYFSQGFILALTATIMPGPFQAYLLVSALGSGWKRTMPAVFAPLITDGPIIFLVLFLLTKTPLWFLDALCTVGGIFILYLAFGLIKNLKKTEFYPKPDSITARQGLFQAVILNVLNPNPYIFWSVVAGPIVLTGWRESTGLGVSFLAGFYVTFICSLSTMVILFSTAGKLEHRINRILSYISVAALTVFGIYQIVIGVMSVI